MFEYLSNSGECYIIEVLDNGIWEPIGDVTLSEKDIPIVIGKKDFWGKGLATKILKYLLKHATKLGYVKIGPIEVYKSNRRSLGLYQNVGFKEVSESKDSIFLEIELGTCVP
jgi:RimJ/RimL family protein N-acetyltransferase